MTSSGTVVSLGQPDRLDDGPLTAILRQGARQLLAQAVEAEAFLAAMKGERLADGRDRLVRHGHGPERPVQTGIGPVAVQRVRARDRGGADGGERIRFTSAIPPRWARGPGAWMRGTPILYLRGASMGDVGEAGQRFRQAKLDGMAGGGVRESMQSWRELLVDLEARGLSVAPKLATGDGALGFWRALEQVSPATRHQRCTVHETVNVMDKLPKSVQPAAKTDLREIGAAPDRATAETAVAPFAGKYGAKYDKAVACLVKDRDALLAFYDFPAEHWDHLRTSTPIESVFATVRHRPARYPGALSQHTARLMAFKRVMTAAKTWQRLKGQNQCPKSSRASPSATASRSPTRRTRTPPDHGVTQFRP